MAVNLSGLMMDGYRSNTSGISQGDRGLILSDGYYSGGFPLLAGGALIFSWFWGKWTKKRKHK